MAHLTFTAYYTRKWIKYAAIGLIIYTILHILVVVTWRWVVAITRPETPPPAAEFGRLPYPDFPFQEGDLSFNYVLETATGGFPETFPDRVTVFANENYSPNFASLNQAQEKASAIGFTFDPIEVEPSRFRWRRIEGVSGLLEMHIFNNQLDMVLDWPRNSARYITAIRQPISQEEAFLAVKQFMRSVNIWSSVWEAGSYGVLYYEFLNGQLVEVDRLSRADFIQVNLLPAPLVEELDYVTADPKRPVVWALVARNNREVVEMHFHYQGIVREQYTDYPIRPVSLAWASLLAGEGYVAAVGQNTLDEPVVIRHFDLAYYLDDDLNPYTQPVYVIKGDNGFIAYVPAISAEYLEPPVQE